MNKRQLGLTVAVIAGLVIAFFIGFYVRLARLFNPRTISPTVVTISSPSSSSTTCDVDKHGVYLDPSAGDQIEWNSASGKTYWVRFNPLTSPVTNYTPESPIRPQQDTVVVNGSSGPLHVLADPSHGPTNVVDYYLYDIYDPATNQDVPCKNARDRDTGVIIKR